MKLKLDENLPGELAEELRAVGHDADTVYDEGLGGAPDPDLLQAAQDESRILLTLDKGIGNVRVYPPERQAGIVLFRPPSSGRRSVLGFIRQHLPQVLELDITGRLVVVTDQALRIR